MSISRNSGCITIIVVGVILGLNVPMTKVLMSQWTPSPEHTLQGTSGSRSDRNNEQQEMIKITIGSRVFTATLSDGPAADALRAMLPLTLDMQELNGNEKFHRFDTELPTSDHKPGTIQAGDLMLWSGHTLVLFYRTFKTGYPYTRIGHIDDPQGLAEAVGKGRVVVRFEGQ